MERCTKLYMAVGAVSYTRVQSITPLTSKLWLYGFVSVAVGLYF